MNQTQNPPALQLGVVVPAYNEAEGLRDFHARLASALQPLGLTWGVVYVDDGSRDSTAEVMRALRESDPRVGTLYLARNFGKELAMTAGLDAIDAEAVVVIDADLQDPPELIAEFVQQWQQGYDVVFGQRTAREGESWFKRTTASLFYRTMERLSDTPVPRDTGDFRLMSRRALDALRQLRERQRFMKGLFAWVGFRQIAVPYRREPRHAGNTKWNYWRLWNFAIEGITSFSTAPLRIATYVGVLTSMLAFAYGSVIVLRTLIEGNPVPGYPSLMVVMLFLGGVQLMALGVIGEYLGRLYQESKQRPLYLIDRYDPPTSGGVPRPQA